MEVPLQITVRHLKHSPALQAGIRERAARLTHFHPRITSCRVTVAEEPRHRNDGKRFQACVGVRIAGSEIVANHDDAEDPYTALRGAFDAARRQLEELARVQRRQLEGRAAPATPE